MGTPRRRSAHRGGAACSSPRTFFGQRELGTWQDGRRKVRPKSRLHVTSLRTPISGSRHSKSHVAGLATFSFRGSTKLASLFRVFPTALATIHAFISTAGYGLSKSTGS